MSEQKPNSDFIVGPGRSSICIISISTKKIKEIKR